MILISKIIINYIVIVLSLVPIFSVYAQTNTATSSQSIATPTKSQQDQDIESLKEKIATKVAELRQKNNKAVSGTIRENSETKLILQTSDEVEYQIILDPDLTKFYQITGARKKEVKLKDFKKGSYITATGVINDKTIEANSVYLDTAFLVGSGKVIETNKEDFYFRLITTNKENYTLDFETTTKLQIVNIKSLELEKVGFSKIKEGDTIHFVVGKTGEEKEVNRYSAQKILVIPQEYFIK